MKDFIMIHRYQQFNDWKVHIFMVDKVGEVYYQKKGFPMMYAFGLPEYQPCEDKHYTVNEMFEIAWSNLPCYMRYFY